MALGDPYVQLADFKARLKLQIGAQDSVAQDAINAASGEIEKHCNRQFNKADTATARVYEPKSNCLVDVDDFWTTDGLIVEVDVNGDGSFALTVPASDYELYPANGVVDGQIGWPFYKIRFVDDVLPMWSRRRNTVRVTAKWGWSATPEAVREACMIIAHETFQLKDAPFGTAGMDQFGNIYHVRDNRIAAGKLARYCRRRIPAG